MADVTIQNLPPNMGLTGTERVPLVKDTGAGWLDQYTTTGAIADAATQATYVLVDASFALPDARTLAPVATETTVTDNGVGSTIAIGLADTAVTPGNYGDSTHLVQITVDDKGRITAAQEIDLNASFQTYLQNLPTSLPAQPNIPWNNGGIVSIS